MSKTIADTWFEGQTLVAITAIIAISLVHVGSAPLIRLAPKLAGRISDFSVGIGLGYVFLYLLPKIGDATVRLETQSPGVTEFLIYRFYLLVFLGFIGYYLIDFDKAADGRRDSRLMINVVAFSAYNALVAITAMHLERRHYSAHLVFTIAFGLHLFGINYLLTKWHGRVFGRWMRWVFVMSLVVGSLIGISLDSGDHFVMVATALVGGIIMVMSVRIKLPTPDLVNLIPFLSGTAAIVVLAFVARSIGN